MKKNIFKETYAKVQAIKEAYEIANVANDEEGKKKTLELHKKLMLELSNRGTATMHMGIHTRLLKSEIICEEELEWSKGSFSRTRIHN